ncbi:putative mitochondrial aspartate aminotransferase [Leptomonas pyrrhocoris]|uniref:Putative mitochondrial aspartate aminotransferase n=1 Tax=Leptomonas pyrrhocoris TaxID=157538 RepID=A0A0M9FZA4_LEPPY|nr:putative mitochondrial aspartate aminotransferase [Leptomonas pyrrhocoris]XP_015657482.1 putative mitochondrial aspartate aminotransferase [Leptomonas pyrrhocoris]KPA79042.1 putative mitochondrial aspartate aminotransferase [Leptomonas pyrrhocoris]KPA79043.1 putative mitochondrial aspartate aminotransferase [Leptomonas pyrrhocoris]|eukprot:XP_015657481.1 putative mitochondrial aspartate aminotransferase [Leptomonas pyrrhocoris]
MFRQLSSTALPGAASGLGVMSLCSTPLHTARCHASTAYFAAVPRAPPDAIMGIAADFAKDTNPNKVNLCIGVFRDEHNKPYILKSVRTAMVTVAERDMQMDYAPIAGLPSFVNSMQALCFGKSVMDVQGDRIASAQTLSGTGALHLGLELLQRYADSTRPFTVHISSPSYTNHYNILQHLKINYQHYPYYNMQTHRLDIDAMLNYFRQLPPQSVVLLHACAHNPTGCDPTPDEWEKIIDVVRRGDLIPFIDMAYQGFATGDLERDAYAVRAVNRHDVPTYLVSQSLAKSFGLYGQRTGALHIRCTTQKEKANVLTQLQSTARATYSNPPIFGARVADEVLRTPHLREQWKTELLEMAQRLEGARHRLVAQLRACGSTRDWEFLEKGVGMMSLTGLTEAQVIRLQEKYSVYLNHNGRLAFSGLNIENVAYTAQAIHDIVSH